MIKRGLIFLAGGQGRRMGGEKPKQFHSLGGEIVAHLSLKTLLSTSFFEEVVIVCAEPYRSYFSSLCTTFARPGKRRQDSVANGEKLLSSTISSVVIHDAARPLVSQKEILALVEEGDHSGAAVLGIPLKYTLKESFENQEVKRTLPRSQLWEIQTPQYLKRSVLRSGLEKVAAQNLTVTDDVSLAELVGHPVKIVKGSDFNFKLTTPLDFILAEECIKREKV